MHRSEPFKRNARFKRRRYQGAKSNHDIRLSVKVKRSGCVNKVNTFKKRNVASSRKRFKRTTNTFKPHIKPSSLIRQWLSLTDVCIDVIVTLIRLYKFITDYLFIFF